MPDKLTALNAINAATYAANLVVTYGSQLGWFGATNQQQSLKYQTLVTPVGFAFAIWGPIFVLQGLFTVAQLLPGYRSDPEVHQGVGYWYVATCVAQFGWTMSFAQDVVWLSMVFMLLILVSLGALLHSLGRVAHEALPRLHLRYVLLHAPFLLHFGWITAATAVNVNVCIVKYATASTQLQLGAAVASIALLLLPGLCSPPTLSARIGRVASADPLYSLVLVWAFYGIHAELAKPTLEGALRSWCPPLVAGALSGVAALMSALLGGVVTVRLVRLAAMHGRGLREDAGAVYPRFEDQPSEPAGQGKL